MPDAKQFYINGAWVAPVAPTHIDIINPATEDPVGQAALGNADDVNAAVAAANAAFPAYAATSREDRVALLTRIGDIYESRMQDMADAIQTEMGAPSKLALQAQAASGLGHIRRALSVLRKYEFDIPMRSTMVTREPIGVCGLITPWNWPMNQVCCKVAPALAAGCTMVLKPSEIAPLSTMVFIEILHEAGVPAGVCNMVIGDGPGVGAVISAHPDIDMVSFTGSTRAGILVSKSAADTVKRVALELGGKSPNIILDDADMERVIKGAAMSLFSNTGQSCNAPSRLLVPSAWKDDVESICAAAAERCKPGDPKAPDTRIGPLANGVQFARVQTHIENAMAEGAKLVAGGPGRPDGLNRGFYVRPTVFSDVTNDMSIARNEVFGPVLAILTYDSEDEAVAIANDTDYGLSSYVSSGSLERARGVARRIRAGMVHINGAGGDNAAPFGGYKQSGNGREHGVFGFEEFLEVKSMFGYAPG